MSEAKQLLFTKLSDAVVNMDEAKAAELANQVVQEGVDIYEAIEKGLSHGMQRVGELYEQGEYFIPELLLSSDAMYAGLDILKVHLKSQGGAKEVVVIGVVQGDTHDIGKNIVKIMLETAGYKIIDLGRDVPPQKFVEAAKTEKAGIIALATLMTTTMEGMSEVVRVLERENLKGTFKVMIGGGPVSQAFADKIGADCYAANAVEAVRLAGKLTERTA